MNQFTRNLLEGMIANRIMVMRLAGALGMSQEQVNKYQDEAIELAKKDVDKQYAEISKKIKESREKNDKNNK